MHVFEVNGEILRFATLLMVDKLYTEPEGYVKFNLGYRPDNVRKMFHISLLKNNF